MTNSVVINDHFTIALEIAERNGLPKPTIRLDNGMNAVVFECEDENMVIRVESDPEYKRELDLLDYQETGGVVKIYAAHVIGGEWLVTWKEKLNTNFDGYFYKNYSIDSCDQIFKSLSLYEFDGFAEKVKVLKKYPETECLAHAIECGLDTRDLSHVTNLGMTKDNRLVAYDI